jgi:hypothetical protein
VASETRITVKKKLELPYLIKALKIIEAPLRVLALVSS